MHIFNEARGNIIKEADGSASKAVSTQRRSFWIIAIARSFPPAPLFHVQQYAAMEELFPLCAVISFCEGRRAVPTATGGRAQPALPIAEGFCRSTSIITRVNLPEQAGFMGLLHSSLWDMFPRIHLTITPEYIHTSACSLSTLALRQPPAARLVAYSAVDSAKPSSERRRSCTSRPRQKKPFRRRKRRPRRWQIGRVKRLRGRSGCPNYCRDFVTWVDQRPTRQVSKAVVVV